MTHSNGQVPVFLEEVSNLSDLENHSSKDTNREFSEFSARNRAPDYSKQLDNLRKNRKASETSEGQYRGQKLCNAGQDKTDN